MLGSTDAALPVKPTTSASPAQVTPQVPSRPGALEPGSVLAQALFQLYTGQPVTKVDSPPGAGKSTLVAQAVTHLFENTDMSIVVAVFTNQQGADLSEKIAAELGPGKDGNPRVRAGSGNIVPRDGVLAANAPREGAREVVVRTVASCKVAPPKVDLLVIDEAYQTTFADFADAADLAAQVLVVGDPGQIGPVVSFNAEAWERMKAAPHMRCPDVLSQRDDVAQLTLPSSYRLGPQTVATIAPLYDFAFDSLRPQRSIQGHDGEIRTVRVPVRETEYDIETMRTVATLAASYVGMTVVESMPDGTTAARLLTARDVAVVVSRNTQVSAVEALLVESGFALGEFTVGSADRLQGGQWHAVVAVDPALAAAGSGHALSSGRLCVMLSRHMSHLTWVCDETWEDTLAASEDTVDAAKGAAVRALLEDFV